MIIAFRYAMMPPAAAAAMLIFAAAIIFAISLFAFDFRCFRRFSFILIRRAAIISPRHIFAAIAAAMPF